MVNSKTFDLTVNAFGKLVTEVFSGTDESQKAKLRKMLNQFTKTSRKRKPAGQIVSQEKKRRLSDINYILPPELLEKILELLNYKDICQTQLVCKRWNEVIGKGSLLTKASGKMLVQNSNSKYESKSFCYFS